MKQYLFKDYDNSLANVAKAVIADFTGAFVGKEVISNKNEIGIITGISNLTMTDTPVSGLYAYICVDFPTRKATYISWALGKSLTFKDDMSSEIEELTNVLTALYAEYKIILAERYKAEQAQFEEERQARLAEEAAKKAEIKRQAKINSILANVNKLGTKKAARPTGFYSALGWLYSVTKTISASIPDFCDSWFVKSFGEAPRTVVDTTMLTTGGYLKKWNCSFSISIKDNSNVPQEFEKYVVGKKINNTELIYDLVQNCGFRFGTTQDLDEILSYIPEKELENFRLGLIA